MKEHDVAQYKRHRSPPGIIAHGVWRYYRFALRYRDVEELLAERGVVVTYASIRRWSRRFGQAYANGLHRRRPRPGDTWHRDAIFLGSNGATHSLWRAVTRMGRCSISWCNTAATSRRRRSPSVGCSKGCSMCHAYSSPTSS
jgi:transposase-like protein